MDQPKIHRNFQESRWEVHVKQPGQPYVPKYFVEYTDSESEKKAKEKAKLLLQAISYSTGKNAGTCVGCAEKAVKMLQNAKGYKL